MFGSDHASREIKRNREESLTRAQKRRDNTNMYSASNENTELEFKEVSAEELEKIKLNIREKGKKRRLRITIFTVIFTLIISFGIYYILSNIVT